MLNGPQVAQKIMILLGKKNIKKTTLGEALGVAKKASSQAKSQKLILFMRLLENNKVDLTALGKVADYFELPIESFFFEGEDQLGSQKVHMAGHAKAGDIIQAKGQAKVELPSESKSLMRLMASMKKDERKLMEMMMKKLLEK